MIFPRSKAEVKQFEEIVEQNTNADDWISDDPRFSPLTNPPSSSVEEILKHVGDLKLRSK